MNVTVARMTAVLAATPAQQMSDVLIDAETTRLALPLGRVMPKRSMR